MALRTFRFSGDSAYIVVSIQTMRTTLHVSMPCRESLGSVEGGLDHLNPKITYFRTPLVRMSIQGEVRNPAKTVPDSTLLPVLADFRRSKWRFRRRNPANTGNQIARMTVLAGFRTEGTTITTWFAGSAVTEDPEAFTVVCLELAQS